ncbi:MAG TPA: ABC transporter permease [Bryobacteraceae bacterium]
MAKIQGLFRNRAKDSDFDDEMRTHLRLLTERFVRQGMTPSDAVFAARRQFGNAGLLQQDHREMRTFLSLETFWRDLRYGARQLRMNWLFTAASVFSLALGIGANTAVFTLLDQLVLRLLPVYEPERLVMIWSTGPHFGGNDGPRKASYPMYQDFQRKAEAFESVFCRFDTPAAIAFEGGTERVDAELVSGNYFQALGVGPAIGRVFSPEADDQIYKGHPVVVLSHGYWTSRFAGDPKIVGAKILVNDYPMEVVGVAAAGFTGLDPSSTPHIWVPIQMKPVMTPGQDDLGERRSQWIQMFARLKPGYTVASARASLQPLFHQILLEEVGQAALRNLSRYDRERFLKRTALVETAATGYSNLRQRYSTALIVLMGMAALILLIACSNVANLLIARAVARQKEIAVHLAIGAARRNVIARLLTESLLLAFTGAGLGLVLSVVATRALLNMLPANGVLLTLHAEPDPRILLFCAGVALATVLLFGLAPALQATKLDLWTTLKDMVGAVTGAGAPRLRKALVTTQVALSLLLLVGAGLFSRSLINLKNTQTGFRGIENVASFQVDPAKQGYRVPRIHNFYATALNEIRAIPGVKSAAYAMWPLLDRVELDMTVAVESYQGKDGENMQAYYNQISPGYWQAMGIRLLAGRDFDDSDRFDPPDGDKDPVAGMTVAIVNRSFAEHFFRAESPIGRHIGCCHGSATRPDIRIVGMVENSVIGSPRDGALRQVFFPYLQLNLPKPVTFYVRTGSGTASILPQLRRVIAKLDGATPVYDMKTLDTQLNETLSTERLIASLSVVFGVLATALAALGLYGVTAFVVASRTKEIGLRMALGATRLSVLWLVLKELLMLLGTGLLIGLPCAYTLSRSVSSQLFDMAPVDAWTCAGAVAILVFVAAVSGFLPARRASAIDPIKALRYQ